MKIRGNKTFLATFISTEPESLTLQALLLGCSDPLTCQRGELDSLGVRRWNLSRLDHQVRLDQLGRVAGEAEVHRELIQGQRQAEHEKRIKLKVTPTLRV